MTHPSIPITTTVLRGAPPPLGWRSWPLGDGGVQVWLLLAAVAVVAVTVGSTTGSAAWAAAAAAMVSAAAWRIFVPVVFECSAMGISQQVLSWRRRVPWTSVERVEIGREGVFLSLEGAPVAALRGLYLPWGPHRAELLAQVEYFVPGSRVVGNQVNTQQATESAIEKRLHDLEVGLKEDAAASQAAENRPNLH